MTIRMMMITVDNNFNLKNYHRLGDLFILWHRNKIKNTKILHATIKFSVIKSITVYVSFALYYSMITPISWMGVLIVRWEIVVIQHLKFRQMNPELEEAAGATVVVATAAKSNVQSHHWKMQQ